MKSLDLGKSLSSFASIGNEVDSFTNPFENDVSNDTIEVFMDDYEEYEEKVKTQDKSKRKKDKFKKVLDKGSALLDKYSNDLISDFDMYLENRFLDDEDSDLKNSLVSLGRKYARDTTVSAEESEIQKAFSASEKKLDALLKEIEADKGTLQKDIDNMRLVRSKNFKTLSELIEAKTSFHNTSLSVIKEINNIKKTQLDLKYKAEKNKPTDENAESVGGNMIQQLFGMGRGNILSSVGGYEGASGAFEGDGYEGDGSYDDETIQKAYFSDSNYGESDGDRFLKYEDMGVEYILIVDPDDGSKYIIAEDRDGNIVPDYPTPTNIDELNFNISESTMTATDDFHRNYKVRMGE